LKTGERERKKRTKRRRRRRRKKKERKKKECVRRSLPREVIFISC